MRVRIEGLEAVERRLRGIADRVADCAAVWPRVIDVLAESAARTFDSQGRPTRWPPRADALSHPILDKTGALRDSMELRTSGSGSVVRSDATSLEFGTEVEYGKYHQSDAPRQRLPRRPFVMFQPDDMDAIRARVREYWWWGD